MLASTPMSLSVKCALLRGHVCVCEHVHICVYVGGLFMHKRGDVWCVCVCAYDVWLECDICVSCMYKYNMCDAL